MNPSPHFYTVAIKYGQWKSSLREPEELFAPCRYILVYPSHQKTSSDSDGNAICWVFSALSIGEENNTVLQVNLPQNPELWESASSEYIYYGKLSLTRSNIHIHLRDEKEQETVCLSFYRPPHDSGRYLGIASALSPGGHPVSFKCACFDLSRIRNIHYPFLYELLSRDASNGDSQFIALEDRDINQFHSDRVFE